jgi:hypothetical protein
MEAFESFVALAMGAEGLSVSGPTKFKAKRKAKNGIFQEHGYEIDLIGARGDKLVLASVKSFFGSGGVRGAEVTGKNPGSGAEGYKILNDRKLRKDIIEKAAEVYGYKVEQIEMRLYAGKFKKGDEDSIREWCGREIAGGYPIQVIGVTEIFDAVKALASSKTYIDNPTIVAFKVMAEVENALAAKESKAKPVKKSSSKFNPEMPTEDLPVGAMAISKKDGISGLIIGYSNQGNSNPYVKIRNEDTGVTYIRAASTLELKKAK